MASILKPTKIRLSMFEARVRGYQYKYSLTPKEGYAMLNYLDVKKSSKIPLSETEESYEKRLKILLDLDREETV